MLELTARFPGNNKSVAQYEANGSPTVAKVVPSGLPIRPVEYTCHLLVQIADTDRTTLGDHYNYIAYRFLFFLVTNGFSPSPFPAHQCNKLNMELAYAF